MINDLGIALKSLVVKWTKEAKACYDNGLRCSRCPIADDIKTQCKMKPVVLELVRKFGKPHNERKRECLDDYQREK